MIISMNKEKERQDTFIYTYRNISYIHNMHTSSIKGVHKRIPTDKICTYCSMNKQYIKGYKMKKEFT